jgi:hypothetical protein
VVVDAARVARADLRHAGVAGSAMEGLDFRIAGKTPCQRVLTAAGADHEYDHRSDLL